MAFSGMIIRQCLQALSPIGIAGKPKLLQESLVRFT